jgi:hypothetical protein
MKIWVYLFSFRFPSEIKFYQKIAKNQFNKNKFSESDERHFS